jgi:hypothetical protein
MVERSDVTAWYLITTWSAKYRNMVTCDLALIFLVAIGVSDPVWRFFENAKISESDGLDVGSGNAR